MVERDGKVREAWEGEVPPPSCNVGLDPPMRRSTETVKCRITQTAPHDKPGESSFLMPKISAKFKLGHSKRRRQMQVGSG